MNNASLNIWHKVFKTKAFGVGKIQYPARILGYYLATTTFAVNQYYTGSLDNFNTITGITLALLFPHLAFAYYKIKNCSKKVEHNSLLIDTFVSGFAVVLMDFNFFPTLAMLTLTAAGNMVSGGIYRFLIGLIFIALGMVTAITFQGFNYDINHHIETPLVIITSVFLTFYTLLFAFASKMIKVKIQNQKKEINAQKLIIEEKNREIIDSINYAKRIQAAILPSTEYIKTYLPDSFIIYKPKDIVAGDFYWVHPLPEKNKPTVLFAACDCTGHGVPGALVSVVCHNALNRSVTEYGLSDPGKILDKTREIVIEEFEKSDGEVKDGMDIALCLLSDNTLLFSGANNPLWIIRDNEIIEIKADKQPIGKHEQATPFSTKEIKLKKNDNIYIFSDGYADQFGGEKSKKLKASNMKKLFLSIQDKSLSDQKSLIDEQFEIWKGDLEQLDDICIIGVKYE